MGSIGGTQVLLSFDIWDLPGSGIKYMSPALAGRFFTTEPPEEPSPLKLKGLDEEQSSRCTDVLWEL